MNLEFPDTSAYKKQLVCLVLLIRDSKILLGLKKEGLGKGKWNGFGGHLEEHETEYDAAIREMQEECGLQLETKNLNKIGRLEFTFEGKEKLVDIHVFKSSIYKGEVTESEEMLPKWFSVNEIPYDRMWPDDKIWYPLMFSGKKFKGHFHMKGENEVIAHSIQETDSLS